MSNFLEFLRQQNIFGSRPPYGNDLPQQGGITGRMPYNPSLEQDYTSGIQFPGASAIPPPQFGMPGIEAPDVGRNDPYKGITFSKGPLDINEWDMQQTNMPVPGQGMPEMDAGQRMREIYNPAYDASQRFERMIDEYPGEGKIGAWKGIGSLLKEFAYGPAAGQEMRNRARQQPIEDWKNKIGVAQQAANLERYENVNQRTMAYNQMSMELREKAQEAKERNDETNARIRQQRADIYAFKATHPDYKLIFTKGRNVTAINPQTLKTHDTGIPTGSMTELDKITLQGEQRLDQISATGEQARQTEGVRQTGRLEAIGARGEQARQTKEVPPGGVSGKSLLPSQIKIQEFRKAREILNSNPELAPFIKLGTSPNEFEIIKPNPGAFTAAGRGPTAQQYSDIINTIYGQPLGGRGGMAGPGPASTMTKTQTNTQTGEKRTLISTDGGKTWRVQ